MKRKEFLHRCAIAALPQVMENYRLTEHPVVNYEMDEKATKEIVSQSYKIAFEMLEKYDWNNDINENLDQ